jgi:tripartite-type tricarboxylate transporter receptor subunit TctC
MPEVRALLTQQGMEVLTSSPEELRERMKADAVRWAQVVKTAGIKAE